MRNTGWSSFMEESLDAESIKTQVASLERKYRIWLAMSMVIVSAGTSILLTADKSDIVIMAFGLLTAIAGVVLIAATKLQAGMSLSMYRIILSLSKR